MICLRGSHTTPTTTRAHVNSHDRDTHLLEVAAVDEHHHRCGRRQMIQSRRKDVHVQAVLTATARRPAQHTAPRWGHDRNTHSEPRATPYLIVGGHVCGGSVQCCMQPAWSAHDKQHVNVCQSHAAEDSQQLGSAHSQQLEAVLVKHTAQQKLRQSAPCVAFRTAGPQCAAGVGD